MWYGLSQWHCSEAGNGAAAAAAVLKKACRVLPDCSLLYYAAAELQESRGEIEAARSLYEERVEVSFTIKALHRGLDSFDFKVLGQFYSAYWCWASSEGIQIDDTSNKWSV